MRSYLPAYELKAAPTLEETLRLLGEKPGEWRPFAGGTDLMVQLEAGRLPHRKFVSIWHLAELRGIEVTDGWIAIGALTTYSQIRANETLRREFPMLGLAAAETGAIAIQNRGTIGGNIANASPAADTPPALLCYDAEVDLISAAGARRVPYESFHQGYKKMDLRPDELIARVRLPRRAAAGRVIQYYRKVGTRKAQAISKVVLAGLARVDNWKITDIRIALGSVAPTTVRCKNTEAVLRGQRPGDLGLIAEALRALASDIAPIDDIRSTAAYRRRVAQNLLEEFLVGEREHP